MTASAPAVLHGGRDDGYRDHVLLPAPAMVAVAFCSGCKRRHLHEVLHHDIRTGLQVYMRDLDTAEDGTIVYRQWDVDATLEQLLAEPLTLPAPATFAGSMSARGLRSALGG